MKNCIHFDESSPEIKKCVRCDTGYRVNLISGSCIECNSDGKTGDSSDIFCNFWTLNVESGDNKGRCENVFETDVIVNEEKIKRCVKCNSDYVI